MSKEKNIDILETDWELSGDFYQRDRKAKSLRLEDFIEASDSGNDSSKSVIPADTRVQQVAADVGRVVDLLAKGCTSAVIAQELHMEVRYVTDIQICLQSFPEDDAIAVAHLMLG